MSIVSAGPNSGSRVEKLAARVRELRLKYEEIIKGTGLNAMTISRALTGRSEPRAATLDRIEAFVTAQEIAQRDHLLAVHGVPARTETAA